MPDDLEGIGRAAERLRQWAYTRIDQQGLDIARLYRSSRGAFVDRLRHVFDTFLLDEPGVALARRGPAAAAIEQAIAQTVDGLAEGIAQQSIDMMQDLLATGGGRAASAWGDALEFDGPLELAPPSTRDVLLDLTTTVVGGGTFFDRVLHMGDQLKAKLAGTVRGGLLGGEDFDTIRDRVMGDFGVDRLAEPKFNAYGSVLTYKNEARRQWNGLMSALGAKTDSVRVWYAVVTGAKSETTTPGCAARHGLRIDEDLDGEAPPRHYNCRCTVALYPADADLERVQAEGDAWLQAHGYSRRQAMAEEAARMPGHAIARDRMREGWPWGARRVLPAFQAAAGALPGGYHYRGLDWRQLPAAAVRPPGDGWLPASSALEAMISPDQALLRRPYGAFRGAVEVLTDGGWAPLAPRGGRWIPTATGAALDSPELGPPWTPVERRVDPDLLARWPGLQRLALPASGTSYAQILRPDQADAWTLGVDLDAPSGLAFDYQTAPTPAEAAGLALRGSLVPDPHLALLTPARGFSLVVRLADGLVLHQSRPLEGAAPSPYLRAALLVPAGAGLVWAVRPRGLSTWSMPGGHLGPGELASRAAEREFEEETGQPAVAVRALGLLYRPWSTTAVYLGVEAGERHEPTHPDESDGAARVGPNDLDGPERLWLWTRRGTLVPAEAAA